MPIYEYKCNKCEHEFEKLCLSPSDEADECPACGSDNVEKLMSVGCFRPNGVPTGSGGFKPPACHSAPSGG